MRLSKSNGCLLTGATGLIGCALLERLLTIDGPTVYCLTRSMSAIQAKAHLRSRISEHVPDAEFSRRVVFVEGDITRPRLGMSERVYSAVRDNVDVIFHCAAVTSFLARSACWDTNISGLRILLDLTREMRRTPLLVYFGSAAACGAYRDRVLYEDEYLNPDGEHFVEYTRTKARAEQILLEPRSDCEVLVLRPSMVVPDITVTDKNAREAIWPLILINECEYFPVNGTYQFDTVPLSYVADYAVRIACSDSRDGLYHLTAGPDCAPTWGSIVRLVNETLGAKRPTQLVPPRELDSLRKVLGRTRFAYIQRMRHYLPFMNQNVTFARLRLDRDFGAPAPSTFDLASYLPHVLRRVTLDSAFRQSSND